MDTLLQDLRFAVRTLRKSPGFTALAVLCLALGIGVNTTLFSVVNAALLRPFPFDKPDELVILQSTHQRSGVTEASLSYKDFVDWREQATSFVAMAGFDYRSLVISDAEEPERLQGSAISWNLFPMLGIRPILGRGFREDEDRVGGEPVVLLSHELWMRRFQGDSGVLGRTLLVNATPRTIVGVMPPRFAFPENQQLWVPLAPIVNGEPRTNRALTVMARLRPEVTRAQATADVTAVAKRLEAQYPVENAGWSGRAASIADYMVGEDTKLIILTMMGAVTFVLLIACANVANLMLARATARHREIAIRAAIGAGRARIVRQLLTESVLVALLAGAFGVLIGAWGVELINASFPPSDRLPYYIGEFAIDGAVLLYTLVLSIFTGVVFGLAPALQAGKTNLLETLREGGRGGGPGAKRNRLRASLATAEVALSLVLLVGASLFVKSFMRFQQSSAGFDTAPLMTMRFYLPGDSYDPARAKTRRTEDVVRRIETIPGVEAATASNLVPLGGGGGGAQVIVEGRAVEPGDEPRIYWTGVTSHFFRTLGVPIVAGRDFTDAEAGDSSSVAIVSQSFAKRMWPDADAVGRRFRFTEDTAARWITVIGVARDFWYDDLDTRELLPAAYLPHLYLATRNTGLTIRTSGGDPAAITAAVRREIHAADALLPIFELNTMEEVRRLGFWQYGLFGWMFSTFGAIALMLAAIGVYGVIAYGVAQRTHEIGVRVALGAKRSDVLSLVIWQGARLALIGAAFGLVGAFAVSKVVGAIVHNVSATDPLSFVGVTIFLVSVALLASWVPARRATAVDPVIALRAD